MVFAVWTMSDGEARSDVDEVLSAMLRVQPLSMDKCVVHSDNGGGGVVVFMKQYLVGEEGVVLVSSLCSRGSVVGFSPLVVGLCCGRKASMSTDGKFRTSSM